jgi:hypothetical protein
MNKEGKKYLSHIGKQHSFLCVYKYEFLLYSELSESHDEEALLVGFLILLYEYL